MPPAPRTSFPLESPLPIRRPQRQDFDSSTIDLGDLMYEIALIRYELNGDHAEQHRWLASFRSKVSDAARVFIVLLPVFVVAALAIHAVTT